MKKFVISLMSLLILTLCACSPTNTVVVTTQAVESGETPAPSASDVQASTAPATEPTPGVSPSPVSGDTSKMYTSYAHMAAFDPNTGIASFDYFDMLRGDDAVQWLVEQEGYSQADAQAEVSEYAESEFIEKNTNPQLRMVDLSAVPVTLIVNDDGSLRENPEPRTVNIDTLKTMYLNNPDLLLKHYFFEVKVSTSGEVESVNQVYWP